MEGKIDIYQEERPWGNFRRFTNNSTSTVKIVTIKPNEEFSLQSHSKRSEFWRVISGSGVSNIDGVESDLNIGDEKFVPVNGKHRVIAGAMGIQILEISFGQFDEGDIIRYEDKYKRV